MTFRYDIPRSRLKYAGIFSWQGLYKTMNEWFQEREFEFHEKLYKDKIKPVLPEIEIKWYAERKVTGFIMYVINVEFHIWDLEEVEIMKDGKKEQTNRARFLIDFSGSVVIDYAGQFEHSEFRKKIETFIRNHIIKKEVETIHVDKLDYMILNLHKRTKEYLDFYSKSHAYPMF
ncbi:hypothetical protein D6745_01705 [Candidatus Woesearchaeota archaeon]|nr:MAG: hypothetical protein D6745_01705 [Candidatus Woesearchaeota archaeon]